MAEPTVVLTRQGLPVMDPSMADVSKGASVVADGDRATIIATGSEVGLAMAAREQLASEGIDVRVVSMPSWELFDAQPAAYRDSVLPPTIKNRVSVEAGVTIGWERYVGPSGKMIGLDRYGASAPYQEVYQNLGLSAEAVAEAALGLLE